MRQKDAYDSPRLDIVKTDIDIITYSEEDVWLGPEIEAGSEPENSNGN